MRCPGCPPSVSSSPCFSWPCSTQRGAGGKQQPGCVFSTELSKQELVHLLVREARRMAHCRATGIPYQSPLQLAIQRASGATNNNLDTILTRRSGPYVSALHRYPSDQAQQQASSMLHSVVKEGIHHRPLTTYSAHTGCVSSIRYETLSEKPRNTQRIPRRHSSTSQRSSCFQLDGTRKLSASGYGIQELNSWMGTSDIQAPMGALHHSHAISTDGKRRAYLNPNGFEDGFISMPGSFRTSSVSDSCHINPTLYRPEYRQSLSSYCHFRPGLGNTYFYN
ncbi:Hypothetical protein GLP15_3412 [Giardia lamblia P15]|uniref:Uncharacterized protein n=1 Tax=Giardia intestinalis (strain P15) TaxID=658858 RepID=E1F3L4_GIAIA|nr:Hypothetical protein GLP15_3412 [Giardia lamblia P15]